MVASAARMIQLTAEWLLPIVGDPIRRGMVTIAQGRIVEVSGEASPGAVDLGHSVLMPGLVNAHTHLELSHLRGLVPPASRLPDWVRTLMAVRRDTARTAAEIDEAIDSAIAESVATGTVLVGDVGNSLASVPRLRDSRLGGRVFHELIGFGPADVRTRVATARAALDAVATVEHDLRLGLAPHAPYSVSPALFSAIREDLDRHDTVSSVHLGESPEEVEFLQRGTGPWRMLLEELGAWNTEWRVPAASPVEYLSSLDFLDARVLVVHGVQLNGEDLSRLAAMGITIVSCPRSNRHVGVGSPPVEAFYAMDVPVAFGTDSLASAPDLNVFSEMAEARRLAPRVSARKLLESATLVGARALGFGDRYGSLERGKRAALIAVRVPVGVANVEEYLVSGVPRDAVRRVDDESGDGPGGSDRPYGP